MLSRSLEPSLVVGVLVAPLVFELVSDGPEEVALHVGVPSVNGAGSEVLDVSLREVGGVSWAHAFLDGRLVVGSIWSQFGGRSVEVNCMGLTQVTLWALDSGAVKDQVGVAVVEASEPHSTGVSSKSPLTNPDVVLDVLGSQGLASVEVAVLLDVVFSFVPGLVDVGVHDDVSDVVVFEKAVPGWREVEGVVEDEFGVWVRVVNDFLGSSVEIAQGISWGVPPWLIDWLKSIHGWVSSPLVHQFLNVVKSPVDMVLVNVVVRPRLLVPVTNPVGRKVFPMLEIVLINPGEWLSLTRVIKSVLGSLKAMDIK